MITATRFASSSTRFSSKIFGVIALLGLSACGSSGNLTLVAKDSDATLASKSSGAITSTAVSGTDFKICIKKVSLEDESGEDHGNDSSEGEENENEIEFSVGEVDLTNLASGDVTLGSIPEAPVGFKISKIKMKLKKFGSCSSSITYGAQSTNADVEFRWTFNPAVEINDGDTLDLYLSEIATTIAATDNIDSGNFRSTIAQVQARARKR